jgi:2-C-methyl-D-erythritol 4-phosphate cytidylyltransferase
MHRNIGVVLPAGGVGARFGADVPKQLLQIDGLALWVHAIQRFLNHERIVQIVLVCPKDFLAHFKSQLTEHFAAYFEMDSPKTPRIDLVVGGAERWQSVRCGVLALQANVKSVLIHDVARPFLPPEILNECIDVVEDRGACLVAKPVVDTVKVVQGGIVTGTLDRNTIWLAQTPQAFRVMDLKAAYDRFHAEGEGNPTDEATLMEWFGIQVPVIPGSELNDKITKPADLDRLSELWARSQI